MLDRFMQYYVLRKLLGASLRRAAWVKLGAQISSTAYLGPGVRIRSPHNVSIGPGSSLAGRIWLDAWAQIRIGANVLINDRVDLLTGSHRADSLTFDGIEGPIRIGDYAWLPMQIIVLPNVSIGAYAVIGTGAVVTQDVRPYGIAVGNPAKVVRERARVEFSYLPSKL